MLKEIIAPVCEGCIMPPVSTRDFVRGASCKSKNHTHSAVLHWMAGFNNQA
jgi:hypothetical protein